MRQKRFSPLQLAAAALAGAVGALIAAALATWLIFGPQALPILEGLAVIRTQFVGEYDPQDMVDGALEGMVDGLGDRWSHYLTAEAYQAQNQRRTNTYIGVGITVGFTDERGLLILDLQPGAPAEEAGLLPGEVITAVDGASVAGEARYEGSEAVMGPEGTEVVLTVQAPDGAVREVTLTRKAVETDPVSAELLDGGVGYVRVENFYSNSAKRLGEEVDRLLEEGASALVFDMRNNGGGYVGELTDMLDRLLPEGSVFRSESKRGAETVTQSDAGCVDVPMAVLVNADTYSAAELFAAELREAAGAVVVGEETSGKGYSQQAFALSGGGAMNLSTAKYFTGEGVSLIGTGVTLDAEVTLDEAAGAALSAGTLAHADDAQLQTALELLNGK